MNVLVAVAAMSATLPGRTHGLGLFKEPLRVEQATQRPRLRVLNFWPAEVIEAMLVLPGRRGG